jgi:uncharacterized protein YegJ (DUF2314 family)
MLTKIIQAVATALMTVALITAAYAQPNGGIDPEALIDRILEIEQAQREQLQTVTMKAEYLEGEIKDGRFVEKERFDKKIFLKFLPDTTWYFDDYLAYYKEGELQEEKELRKAAKDRREKKKKRKAFDISYRIIRPFIPENRDKYNIVYEGVTAEVIDGHICHEFTVTAIEKDEELIEGKFYFEADGYVGVVRAGRERYLAAEDIRDRG